MKDVNDFTEDQVKFLRCLRSDFDGPTSSASLIYMLAGILDELAPDWRTKPVLSDAGLQSDLEVCGVALQYLDIQAAIVRD